MSTPSRRPPDHTARGGAPSRRRREMLIALLALPILLVLGLLAGNALTKDRPTQVAGSTPASAPVTTGSASATASAPAKAPVIGPVVPTAGASARTTAPAATTSPSASTSAPATTPASSAPSASAPSTSTPPTASSSPAPRPSSPPSGSAGGSGNADGSTNSGTTRATKAPLPRAGNDVVLARGSVGPDVKVWQARMGDRGWSLTADGIFGPRTQYVVRAFQAEKGLPVDGVIGFQTWTAAWTETVT